MQAFTSPNGNIVGMSSPINTPCPQSRIFDSPPDRSQSADTDNDFTSDHEEFEALSRPHEQISPIERLEELFAPRPVLHRRGSLVERLDRSSTEYSHLRHDDQPSRAKRARPNTSDGCLTSAASTAREERIDGSRVLGSPDLSYRPELQSHPTGLLRLPSPSVPTPARSVLHRFPSPPAPLPQETPTVAASSPKTPNKKRKRDTANLAQASTPSAATELTSGPLTADKIIRQLTCDVQLTDDIVELICQAVAVDHGGDNVRLLSPLWFQADEQNLLPQSLRGLKDGQAICFPIHHSISKHWTMGVARISPECVELNFHDSMPNRDRAETVDQRFRAWMDKAGLSQPLVFRQMDCAMQRDGHSCGVHAAVCLRRDLRNESCCAPVEPWSEKRQMLRTLQTVREVSPIPSSTFPHLRELRGRQSLGADSLSVASTPYRRRAMAIQASREPEAQVNHHQSGVGCVIDSLSVGVLQSRLEDAENRLEAAIKARDKAQRTLDQLEIQQETMGDMPSQILKTIQSRGIQMTEHNDAAMAPPPRAMMAMPEGSDQSHVLTQRGNMFGDALTQSYREGVEHSIAAVIESQNQVSVRIREARRVIDQQEDDVMNLEDEVSALQDLYDIKNRLERYSGVSWMALLQSMQRIPSEY